MTEEAQLEVTIRAMRMADLPAVMAIERSSFPTPWTAKSYRYELLENPVSQLLVAEKAWEGETRVVGYLGMWELVDEGHISTLAVHPERRRRGIAKRLLKAALAILRDRGMEKVSLEVRETNRAAQELYRKFGFRVVGRRRGYYRSTQEDALVMLLEGIGQGSKQGGWR